MQYYMAWRKIYICSNVVPYLAAWLKNMHFRAFDMGMCAKTNFRFFPRRFNIYRIYQGCVRVKFPYMMFNRWPYKLTSAARGLCRWRWEMQSFTRTLPMQIFSFDKSWLNSGRWPASASYKILIFSKLEQAEGMLWDIFYNDSHIERLTASLHKISQHARYKVNTVIHVCSTHKMYNTHVHHHPYININRMCNVCSLYRP